MSKHHSRRRRWWRTTYGHWRCESDRGYVCEGGGMFHLMVRVTRISFNYCGKFRRLREAQREFEFAARMLDSGRRYPCVPRSGLR